MFIERKPRKKIEKKIVLTEGVLRCIIKEVLEEALGSFKKQEELGEYCAEIIRQMINNGEVKRTIRWNDKNIKKINLEHKPTENYLGKLTSYDFYNKTLNIHVGRNIKKYNNVAEVISHELMHGNIYLSPKHYETSLKMELDTPDYYDDLIKTLDNVDGIAYNFAYGLYSIFYQEAQAIISQTATEIRGSINKREIDTITKKEFIDLIRQCKSYNIFKLNISDCCDIIDTMSDKEIQCLIVYPFKNNKININISFVKKMNRRIREVSNEALRKCINNAMIVYYDLDKEGKTI